MRAKHVLIVALFLLAVAGTATQNLRTVHMELETEIAAFELTIPPTQSWVVTITPPFRIDVAMLDAIVRMPRSLKTTIETQAHSPYEIIAVYDTGKVPRTFMAEPVRETWCITIYPPIDITLYVQDYVPPKGARFVTAGDYVPGQVETVRDYQFIAMRRGTTWELYEKHVFSWSALGCS